MESRVSSRDGLSRGKPDVGATLVAPLTHAIQPAQ